MAMTMSNIVARERRRSEIRAALRRAFGERPSPQEDALVDPSSGDSEEKERIASRYAKKRWTDVVQDMALECGDLSTLTNDAFIYFLPACLEMSLDDEEGDLAAHSVVQWLSPPDEAAKEWAKERFRAIGRLPDDCRRAIRDVLEYLERYRGDEFPSGGPRHALAEYWASRG